MAGLGLALWAAVGLGRRLTPLPSPRPGADLVTHGAFGLFRHPIYVGIGLAGTGIALRSGGLVHVALALALIALFAVKARYEERLLRAAYPNYADYGASTLAGRISSLIR